jgi:sortase (surface protein transpeptidase)
MALGSVTGGSGRRLSWPAALLILLATACGPPAAVASPAPPPAEVADPSTIAIPRIGVSAPVIPLGLQLDGSMEVPVNFADTGWYRPGPEPGEPGPAIVAGHVDSRTGPAVFFRLRELQPGDEIAVGTTDGHTVRFLVTAVEQAPKHAFPWDRVYAPTGEAALRLITCGGAFDQGVRSYTDNVIVYATAA